MPTKTIKATPEGEVVPFVYSDRHQPPVQVLDPGPETYPIFEWVVKDGKLDFEKVGERNMNKDIQDARCETLTEMMARMAGRSPLEKVQNAVNQGLIPANPLNPSGKGELVDLTKVPDSIVEAELIRRKGQKAADSLPEELKNGKTDLMEILKGLTEEKIKAYIDSKMPKKEEVKSE